MSVSSPGSGTPTGTVTFKDGSTVLGTGTLSTGGGVSTATFMTSKLAVGTHSIVAVYGGDTDDLTGSSSAMSFKVAQDAAATSVTASPTATVYGQSVTFKATVSVSSPGAGTPTGTVTFKDGSTVLGTGALSTSRESDDGHLHDVQARRGYALDRRGVWRGYRRPDQLLGGDELQGRAG